MCLCVVCVLRRSCRTSWRQRASSPGSCRACWPPTCALFTPQTGVAASLCVALRRLAHPIYCANTYVELAKASDDDDDVAFSSSSRPSRSLSPADIGHIQGNLEEISTFQQLLVQSLEEHTKSVQLQDVFSNNAQSILYPRRVKLTHTSFASTLNLQQAKRNTVAYN